MKFVDEVSAVGDVFGALKLNMQKLSPFSG